MGMSWRGQCLKGLVEGPWRRGLASCDTVGWYVTFLDVLIIHRCK